MNKDAFILEVEHLVNKRSLSGDDLLEWLQMDRLELVDRILDDYTDAEYDSLLNEFKAFIKERD